MPEIETPRGPSGAPAVPAPPEGRTWTFLSNHGHVLVHISREPHARLRDVADAVGITERSAQGILADLEAGGYVSKHRVGRRNHYEVHPELTFRHPSESSRRVGELLAIFSPTEQERALAAEVEADDREPVGASELGRGSVSGGQPPSGTMSA